MIQIADRLRRLPPYLFAEIDRKKRDVRARGVDVIDLGIGDPDLPTPPHIVRALPLPPPQRIALAEPARVAVARAAVAAAAAGPNWTPVL